MCTIALTAAFPAVFPHVGYGAEEFGGFTGAGFPATGELGPFVGGYAGGYAHSVATPLVTPHVLPGLVGPVGPIHHGANIYSSPLITSHVI